ncbi:hypothetical protein MMC07_005156 [Pseudocyphellaria aurata]|nr:hypothetical protein [Pseudocyphellaria aurata]
MVTRAGSNLGQFSLPNGGILPSSGAGAGAGYNPNSTQFLRQAPLNSQASTPYSTLSSRNIYPSTYGTSYGDDPFDPYNISTGPYLMPLQDLQTSGSGYAAPDSSRHWTPIPNNRVALSNPNFDNESSIRCGTSTFPLMNSSGSSASSVGTDGSSAFPTLGSLATSLPVNRTLPNPTSKKVSRESNSIVSQGTLNEPLVATNVLLNSNYRSSVSWDHDHVAAGGVQAPASSTSGSTVDGADRSNSKPSTPPRGSQDTANYTYISLPPNPLTTNNVPPISDYLPASSESTNSADNYLGLSNTAFSSGLSGDTMLPSQSSSSLYGYTIGTRNGPITDSMASDGTLVGGLPYNQLRPPQSQPTGTFEASNRSSFESSRPTHRTSISSTNNARY